MGADAAHHCGEIRPSEYLPLPDAISPHPFQNSHTTTITTPCPGALFEHLLQDNIKNNKTSAFFKLSTLLNKEGGAHTDPDEAARTIEKLQEADAHDQVLVVLAHDKSLLPVVDFFPKYANDFASRGWVRQGQWGFLKDFEQALK